MFPYVFPWVFGFIPLPPSWQPPAARIRPVDTENRGLQVGARGSLAATAATRGNAAPGGIRIFAVLADSRTGVAV